MAYNKKAHLRDNIEAIRLMFRLEKEQRTATPEEAGILAAYSGFGGIKAVLSPFGKLTDILRWTQADRELFPLITELHNVLRDGAADEREYRKLVESVKASTFTAFYTPPAIVNAIASSLGEHGVSPGRFLDPSSGTGNFVSAFRPQCHSASGNTPEIVAYEKDLLTGRILARLHPEAQVNIKGFEELPPHRNGYFDVVSSNIPFGDIRVFDPSFDNGTARRFALNSLHNYFFAKGLDAVREGGVLAFITSQGVMNSAMAYPVRQYLMNRSRLLSAVRLPNNLFTDYAGTEVGSDLIILQKDTLSQREYTSLERSFVEVGTQADGTTQNEYFVQTFPIDLGNVKQTILTRHELNECTIRHDRGNLSFINLSDLRNSDDSLDRLDSRVDRSLIRAGDLDLSYAVYLIDRYRSSRFLLDTLDDLTARADYRTDEFLTDNHRLDTRCMMHGEM